MTVRFPTTIRNALLSAIASAADAGTGPARLTVYTGSQPANADNAATDTQLVQFVLADPSFGAPDAGVIAVDADPDINAVATATGTAGWARITDSNGATILDGSVGTSGDFVINSTAIVSGQTVVLASASFSYPA